MAKNTGVARRTAIGPVALAATLLILLHAARAAGDQAVNATILFSGAARYPAESPLTALRQAARHGDDQTRQKIARDVLNALTKYNPSLVLDFELRYYRLVFLASQPNGDTVLSQILVHEPMPIGNMVEGLHGSGQPLLTLFVADDRSTRIHTTATVTQEANPLAADLASLVSTTLPKVLLPGALFPHQLAAPEPPRCDDCLEIGLTLSALELPFPRGKISIVDTITIDDPLTYVEGRLEAIATEIAAEPQTARCVKDAAVQFARVPQSAEGCSPSALQVSSMCTERMRAELGGRFKSASAACVDPELRATAMRFLSTITSDYKAMVIRTELANVPRSHVTVGLVTAFLFSTQQSAPRVRVQSGTIAVDPLARSISLAVVNWFPRGFNPKSPALTSGERYRLFGGVAFTPSFGPAAGGAIALNRNLAFNFGAALMLIDVVKTGETIGSAPVDASPFKAGVALGWFAGFSYNLK